MVDKAALRKQFAKDWKKYYPVSFLTESKFQRKKCKICSINFWTKDSTKNICNEPRCNGGYTFIGNTPAKKALSYTDTWTKFSKIMSQFNYTEIPRYPTIARWRNDTWFTQASIYCFQPHVVTGEVKPPANPLIIPQPSIRFNDIDNVGITSAHYTTHIHMGQHAFMPPSKYKPNEYLRHIYVWLTEGLKIPPEEITFHEDVWAGGGNFGPSIEYFSRGIELGNQVYMQFKQTPKGPQRLKLNVLDHGGGLERQSWFTHGTPTSYNIVFTPVDDKYKRKLKIKPNKKILEKFGSYAGLLNVDEVKNINKAWENIANKINVPTDELKTTIEPLQALYSILDHSRTIVFTAADGALPSNSGGGYNLRFILRRALRMIDKHKWDIDLMDVAREHVRALTGKRARILSDTKGELLREVGIQPMYNELLDRLPDVEKIIEIELKKYKDSQKKAKIFLSSFLKKKSSISTKDLINLYDSQGILPDMVQEAIKEKNIYINIPADFYSKVAEKHTSPEQQFIQKPELNLKPTILLYYEENPIYEFKAKVLDVIDKQFIILDKTAFYPIGGGQTYDTGTLNNEKVVNVEKWPNNIIIHEVPNTNIKKSQPIIGKIDEERHQAIRRNHTSVHIINGIARAVLGNHIWQAGSEVLPEKARLDITHYEPLTNDQVRLIEQLANDVVLANITINRKVLPKSEAEKTHGFRIYQGGAIPGKEICLLEIPGVDTEACGGTHLTNTGAVGIIKILNTKKIQDSVIRLEFTSGKAALEYIQKTESMLKESASKFNVQPEHLSRTCERFFTEWKQQRKQLRNIKTKK